MKLEEEIKERESGNGVNLRHGVIVPFYSLSRGVVRTTLRET